MAALLVKPSSSCTSESTFDLEFDSETRTYSNSMTNYTEKICELILCHSKNCDIQKLMNDKKSFDKKLKSVAQMVAVEFDLKEQKKYVKRIMERHQNIGKYDSLLECEMDIVVNYFENETISMLKLELMQTYYYCIHLLSCYKLSEKHFSEIEGDEDLMKRMYIRLRLLFCGWETKNIEKYLISMFKKHPETILDNEHEMQIANIFRYYIFNMFDCVQPQMKRGRPTLPNDVKDIVQKQYKEKNASRLRDIYKLHNKFNQSEIVLFERFVSKLRSNLDSDKTYPVILFDNQEFHVVFTNEENFEKDISRGKEINLTELMEKLSFLKEHSK